MLCLLTSTVLSEENTFLGPILEYKKDEFSKVYAFRPILYYEANYELKFRSLDILYPFMSYQEDNQRTQFRAFFSMIRYTNFNDYDNLQEKNFSIFPIIDIAWSGKKENNYFSLFPIWGTLKNKYGKEEINYLLFPLYLETKKKNSTNKHFLWPFISKVEGKYVSGFKLWPLFGYERKLDEKQLTVVKESKFFLWPFYASKKNMIGGLNLEETIYFPFYLSSNSALHKSKTYLWPFFNIYTDKISNQTTYNMPWPIIQYKKGVNIFSQRFFNFNITNLSFSIPVFEVFQLFFVRIKNIVIYEYRISLNSSGNIRTSPIWISKHFHNLFVNFYFRIRQVNTIIQ